MTTDDLRLRLSSDRNIVEYLRERCHLLGQDKYVIFTRRQC